MADVSGKEASSLANWADMKQLFKDLRHELDATFEIDGKVFENGIVVALKQVAATSPKLQTDLSLEERALERQWLELWLCNRGNRAALPALLPLINSSLRPRTFLAAARCTVSDAVWLITLRELMVTLSYSDKEKYPHLTRWYSLVQHLLTSKGSLIKSKTALYS